jgi:hypothetical protein
MRTESLAAILARNHEPVESTRTTRDNVPGVNASALSASVLTRGVLQKNLSANSRGIGARVLGSRELLRERCCTRGRCHRALGACRCPAGLIVGGCRAGGAQHVHSGSDDFVVSHFAIPRTCAVGYQVRRVSPPDRTGRCVAFPVDSLDPEGSCPDAAVLDGRAIRRWSTPSGSLRTCAPWRGHFGQA